MGLFDFRYGRLFRRPSTQTQVADQLADLRHTLNSMAQDIAILQEMLGECWPGGCGEWEAQYRWRRATRMAVEHGGRGIGPSSSHRALFPHTLDEEDFLRWRLRASDRDIAYFRTVVARQDTVH